MQFAAILPCFTNDGIPQVDKVNSIIKEIADLTGGVTTTDVTGIWYDETGKPYHDYSKRVETVTSLENVAILAASAVKWCILLEQQSLFIQYRGDETRFIDNPLPDKEKDTFSPELETAARSINPVAF